MINVETLRVNDLLLNGTSILEGKRPYIDIVGDGALISTTPTTINEVVEDAIHLPTTTGQYKFVDATDVEVELPGDTDGTFVGTSYSVDYYNDEYTLNITDADTLFSVGEYIFSDHDLTRTDAPMLKIVEVTSTTIKFNVKHQIPEIGVNGTLVKVNSSIRVNDKVLEPDSINLDIREIDIVGSKIYPYINYKKIMLEDLLPNDIVRIKHSKVNTRKAVRINLFAEVKGVK